MRSSRRTALLVALAMAALLAIAGQARAQSDGPLARALAAYRNLDYDDAAARFRSALAPSATVKLSDADRSRALMYLGATELFRGRRDPAVESFRALLFADPRYRPDELIFPPEVSALFQETRFGVRALTIIVPEETEIHGTADRLQVRIYASSLHQIRAQVTGRFGSPERTLHDGAIGDSLELLWNARDGLGRLREPGRYLLRVTSRSPAGRDEREVEVPLDIERIVQDTLAAPEPLSPSLLLPESEVRSRGARPLVTGLLAAVAVAVLPAVSGAGSEGMSMRFGVAGALGVAGIIGMTTASRPQPLPANIEANRRQREAWEREAERVRTENQTRLSATRLRIRAGRATTVEVR